MRVKFLVDAVSKAGNVKGECDEGAKPVHFKKDQIVDMPETSARHWINRRKAEIYVEEPKPVAKPVATSGKKED